MSTTVEVQRDRAGVARVLFQSDSGVQILSQAVCETLAGIVRELDRDRSLRVVVFEGRGRTFLAGAELRELLALNSRTARAYARRGQRLFGRIAALKAVTLAAIHAPCVGGGCEMALACDLRMAAAAARIGLPEVTLGIVPGWGGTVRATRLLGPAAARRLILTGELLDAASAARIGLVDTVAPDDGFRAAVDARIDQLLKAAPRAVKRAARLIDRFDRPRTKALFDREAREFARCYTTSEPAEGLQAFLAKRAAGWAS